MITIARRTIGHASVGGTIAGIALLLAASPALAASSIFTGVVRVATDQGFSCRAFNTSPTKTLEGVHLIIRNRNGSTVGSSTCPTVAPQTGCGSTGFPIALATDLMTCEATSDRGARLLRATLVNEVTGVSSDAR